MSLATLLQCKSVEAFFNDCNWEGRKLVAKQPEIVKQPLPLCLKVGEFFQQHNWEGKPAELIPTITTVKEETLITQTVKDFFAYLSWEGKPQVAKMPTPTTPSLETKHSQLNLDDLSDLF
ncbi:MAG: hypothetical protein EA365_02445 [Gloeocapsa sp. DLM2.Bin57]|nr:MAG: hypothetical protein EA365_02445 [Gloeocapsa sp. DLM2.Bin57]